jgi:hypothetical protein
VKRKRKTTYKHTHVWYEEEKSFGPEDITTWKELPSWNGQSI